MVKSYIKLSANCTCQVCSTHHGVCYYVAGLLQRNGRIHLVEEKDNASYSINDFVPKLVEGCQYLQINYSVLQWNGALVLGSH